jgi:hypothetical protein
MLTALILLAASALDVDGETEALTKAKLETWPRLYRENDHEGLAAFLSDGFVALQPDGSVETKEQAVAWVRDNKWTNAQQNFRYEITAIRFYGLNTANVYGVGSMDGSGPSGRCRLRYTSANIFVREGGRWRPSFSHTSKPACHTEK